MIFLMIALWSNLISMNINFESPFRSFLSQLLPFLLSFSDDALVLGLSRLGLHIHWLQWFSSVILSCTILYWAMKLWRRRHWIGQVLGVWVTIAQQKARFLTPSLDPYV